MSIPRFATRNEMILCSVCNERYAVFVDQLNPAHKEMNRCFKHMTDSMKKRYTDRLELAMNELSEVVEIAKAKES